MKPVLLCLGLFGLTFALSAQTLLTGKATQGNFEPLPYASVALYKNQVLITGRETDLNGNFLFEDIDPGTYDVEVSFVGYRTQSMRRVKVYAGRTNRLQVCMRKEAVIRETIEVVAYKVPLVDFDVCGASYRRPKEEEDEIKPDPPSPFSTLHCFPNPTTDQVTLTLTNQVECLQLYSLNGQLLRQWGRQEAGQQTINLSNYPSGTYLLEATAEGQRWAAKVIVQR